MLIWGWESDVRKGKWERKTMEEWRENVEWARLAHVWPQATQARWHHNVMKWLPRSRREVL